MIKVLPYTSRIVVARFYKSSANEEWSLWKHAMKSLWGFEMEFTKMVENLSENTKAYRPHWGDGELLWKKDGVLVHNTPYWGAQAKNQFIGGYPYVCEKGDVQATDWVLLQEEK